MRHVGQIASFISHRRTQIVCHVSAHRTPNATPLGSRPITRCVSAGGAADASSTFQVSASIKWPHLGLPHRKPRGELLRTLMFPLYRRSRPGCRGCGASVCDTWADRASQRVSHSPGVPSRGCTTCVGHRVNIVSSRISTHAAQGQRFVSLRSGLECKHTMLSCARRHLARSRSACGVLLWGPTRSD